MIPDYINTKVKRYSPYCLKYNKRYLNFKPQYNYLTTDHERIQVRNFHTSGFGLINPKIPVNFFVILRTEKIQNQSLDKKRFFNLLKLKKYEKLSDGWSGENSKAIDSEILSKANYLINTLAIQPDIYPTPRGTIQFEYYKNSNYLEFEIFPTENKMLKVLKNEPYETIVNHLFDINKEVNAFYES